MFKIGDRVRFLNHVGEAQVTRIINTTRVEVVDEHGLAQEYPVKELVPSGRDRSTEAVKPEPVPASVEVARKPIPQLDIKTEPLSEIALIFLSEDPHEPERGDLELYLANHSQHHLLFNVAAKEDGGLFSLCHGEVRRGEMKHLRAIRRQDVDIFAQTMVDCIFFDDAEYQPREAFSARLKIKVTRFVKRENYRHVQSLGGHALVVTVEQPAPVVGQAALTVRTSVGVPRRSVQTSLPKFEDEIDLHIEQLTTDHRSLSNHEMLMMQMRHFERNLNYAILHSYVQIVFIHGVGSGRLKEEIRKALREYGHRFEDGAHQRYGAGATVVLLR